MSAAGLYGQCQEWRDIHGTGKGREHSSAVAHGVPFGCHLQPLVLYLSLNKLRRKVEPQASTLPGVDDALTAVDVMASAKLVGVR